MAAARLSWLLGVVMAIGCGEDPLPNPDAADQKTPPPPAVKVKKTPEQKTAAHRLTQSGERRRRSTAAMYFGTAKFAKEKLTFGQIKQAVQLFRATNDRYPADWQEFDTAIIKRNRFQLPELPAGDKYVFDSKTGKLMVEQSE